MDRSVLCLVVIAFVLVDLSSSLSVIPPPPDGCPPPRRMPCLCRTDRDCPRSMQCCADEECRWRCVPRGELCISFRHCMECASDRDCAPHQKCCFDGCRRKCVGKPPQSTDCNRCVRTICPIGLKCCDAGCGTSCVPLLVSCPATTHICPHCCKNCKRTEQCVFDGRKWTCVPVLHHGCIKCTSNAQCGRGRKCCFVGCEKKCVPRNAKCLDHPAKHCPHCCHKCRPSETCVFKKQQWMCVPEIKPPPNECNRCSLFNPCKRGMRCCDAECGTMCVPRNEMCVAHLLPESCPHCCEHCKPWERCIFNGRQWICIPEIKPPPNECNRCSLFNPCKRGMQCCDAKCGTMCVPRNVMCKPQPQESCPHCCEHCKPRETCIFNGRQWICIPEIKPPPNECNRCSLFNPCKRGMQCCDAKCGTMCVPQNVMCKPQPQESCPHCCEHCKPRETCIFNGRQWICIPEIKPPPNECNRCSLFNPCKRGMQCCDAKCGTMCVPQNVMCKPHPQESCPHCCEHCRPWEICIFNGRQWICIPDHVPPPRECNRCALSNPCNFKMKCCDVECGTTCVPLGASCPRYGRVDCPNCCKKKCRRCEHCTFYGRQWNCVPANKPGECPWRIADCSPRCNRLTCRGDKMCCDQGCGVEKCLPKGHCRSPRPDISCICRNDCDCDGDQKCCNLGGSCGRICVDPLSVA